MNKTRHDLFLKSLEDLQGKYPEYANTLQLLIEQIKRGKAAQIQLKLQQMRKETW